MTWLLVVMGYLIGSISGSRIVGRRYAPGQDLSRTVVVLDGTGASVVNRGVSPSSLQARAGGRGGLQAAAIDILKAFLPTLAARMVWGDGPEMVLIASGVLIGHVFPVYHRFVGGFGVSPLIGSLVVIDIWAGIVATAVFALIGVLAGSAFLGVEVWPLGLIPWFAATGDEWTLGYAILANVLYWSRSHREAFAAFRAWRADERPWRDRIADFRTYPDYEVPAE